MINKKLFIETINTLEKQFKKDHLFSEHMGMAFPNAFEANLLPDNNIIISQIIKLLEDLTNDNDEWIQYFIWELDFGKEYKDGCVNYKDGTNIDLSSSEKLWEFLKNEQND